ncbi:chromosomal replication initiator protein DnaA [Halobacteriovorax marinus]|uniref:Chromosomal replication initiator protein DnaA n=1 Tax=Halobacteriovorax marinus TaxID=97084 RepID=A0A1Y5F1P6_9BACT|nr:chromosomal replication initiator protein DnaA [Halobacteriovorax marinus]
MSQEFPFEHFLKTTSSTTDDVFNNNKSLKEIKLTSTPPVQATSNNDLMQDNEQEAIFSKDELETIEESFLESLKNLVNPQKYNAYFTGVFELTNITMDSIVFIVANSLIKTMIEKNCISEVRSAIKQVLGKEYEVIINTSVQSTIKDNENHLTAKPKTASEATFTLNLSPTTEDKLSKVESQYIQHMSDSGNNIDPSKTFDNFIVGPSNNLAHATALAISRMPGDKGKYPSLYIHSNSGLGKTHLLYAVANGIKDNFPQYVVYLTTARDFMKEYIESVKTKTVDAFQEKFTKKIDVLMIDDIHELKGKKGTQDELFHVFNGLYTNGKQLIFTSDKAPEEIDGIEERIRTRLQWGLVIDIQKPDFETRTAILKRKAYELDLYLQEDILTLIANSIKANIRELEGSLVKLSAYADVMNVEVDTEMVKDILNISNTDMERKITLDIVAKATSQHFKIPIPDLKSKARTKDIVIARFVAMYLSRKIVNATQEEVGKFYGNRDHSSVVHAERTIKEKMISDLSISRSLVAIENSL